MVEAEAASSPIPPSSDLTQRLASLLRGPDLTGPGTKTGPVSGSPAFPALPPHTKGGPSSRVSVPAGPTVISPLPSTVRETQAEAVRPPHGNPASSGEEPPAAKVGSKRRKAPVKADPAAGAKPKRTRRNTQKMEHAPAPPDDLSPDEIGGRTGGPARMIYHDHTRAGPEVLRRGANPLGVLDELRELGETSIATDPDLVPPLDDLDPERCYLSWTITVKTDADPERLREAFLFFAEDSIGDDPAADARWQAGTDSGADGIGRGCECRRRSRSNRRRHRARGRSSSTRGGGAGRRGDQRGIRSGAARPSASAVAGPKPAHACHSAAARPHSGRRRST